MTTTAEWEDINYKRFATGLNSMRRFKIPQSHTEDMDIIHATQCYKDSLLIIKNKGKNCTRKDHEMHKRIIYNLSSLLHSKNVHVRRS